MTLKMKTEKPDKKGFIAILKEAFTKSGGCCGAGQACGTSPKETAKEQPKEIPKAKEADKPAGQ